MSDRWTTPRHDAWHDEQPTTPEDVEAADSGEYEWMNLLSRLSLAAAHYRYPEDDFSLDRNMEPEAATIRAHIEALTASVREANRDTLKEAHHAQEWKSRAEAAEQRVAVLEAVLADDPEPPMYWKSSMDGDVHTKGAESPVHIAWRKRRAALAAAEES